MEKCMFSYGRTLPGTPSVGFVREVFERKHEREKKSPHCSATLVAPSAPEAAAQ